jgi:hypothetical protein
MARTESLNLAPVTLSGVPFNTSHVGVPVMHSRPPPSPPSRLAHEAFATPHHADAPLVFGSLLGTTTSPSPSLPQARGAELEAVSAQDRALQFVLDVMVQTGMSPDRVDPHVCLLALRRNHDDVDAALVSAQAPLDPPGLQRCTSESLIFWVGTGRQEMGRELGVMLRCPQLSVGGSCESCYINCGYQRRCGAVGVHLR